jgi:D-sedoheptulose 7-phosphate isomerase
MDVVEIRGYMDRAGSLLGGLGDELAEVVDRIWAARVSGSTIFVIGNGGSASMASHFAQDLQRLESGSQDGFRALSLCDNVSILTAYANDCGYEAVFAKQLRALGSSGDMLLCISCSGNSPNVVSAARQAQGLGMEVGGVTGSDGGLLGELMEFGINVPISDPGMAEGIHCIALHSVVRVLAARF